VGNEIADELAGYAAVNGPTAADDTTDLEDDAGNQHNPGVQRYEHPGSHRKHLYWPRHKTHTPPGQDDRWETIRNLSAHVRRVVHKSCRLGSANQNTIYFSSWTHTEEDRNECSYHMMHTDKITRAERTTALRYRTGTMPSAKLRHRFKMADSDKCKLCGQTDGGHHTASGCPHLTKAYTHRHNKAGQLIMNAVRTGRRGAEVIMMDLGADNTSQTCLPHRIPRDALPSAIPDRVKARLIAERIPDAFMYTPKAEDGREKYTIVEIKYCRDTDPQGQVERATLQHERLANTLRALSNGGLVEYAVIVLGVSGTIYKQRTLEQLRALGVAKGELDRLRFHLHRHAVQMLHWIYTTKRK
jgi:hypothetical protein